VCRVNICGKKSVLTNLHALERCNVHGVWETYKEIEVISGKMKKAKKCVWKA